MRSLFRALIRFFVVPAFVAAVFCILGSPSRVDASPTPAVTNVAIPAGYYGIGSNLDFTLTFNTNVTVVTVPGNVPSIALVIGLTTNEALYENGSGTSNLVFSYQVATGDMGAGVDLETNIVLNGATIEDSGGNEATNNFTDTFFTNVIVDGVQPVAAITEGPNPPITNMFGSVTYVVNISDPNLANVSLESNDIVVMTSNGVSVGSVTVGGNTGTSTSANFLVTLSGFTGDGTVWIAVNGGVAMDLAGNTNEPSSDSLPFTVDSTAPTIDLSAPSTNMVNATGSVTYQVSISDANLDVAGSLAPSTYVQVIDPGGANVAIGSISTNATNISYTVTLSGLAGNGTAYIAIPAGAATDFAGNASPASQAVAFIVDNIAPTLSIGSPSVPITNASGQVTFTVTYSDPNLQSAALTPSDIGIVSNGMVAATSLIQVTDGPVSPTSISFIVTLSGFVGNGGLGISVSPGNAVDGAGNAALGGTSQFFTVDTTPPSVVITNLSTNSVNASGRASYTLILNDTNLDTNGIALQALIMNTTSGGARAAKVTLVTNSLSSTNAVLTATLSGFLGEGTLGIIVPGGFVSDLAGNVNAASTSSETVKVDAVLPQLVIVGPSASSTTTNPVTYTLVYQSSHPLVSSLSLSNITLNSTGTARGTLSLAGSSNAWTVTISNITGNGSLGISVAADTATNSVGNAARGAGPSSVVLVGNSALGPVLSAHLQTNGFAVSTLGLPDATYAIQSATNLINPQWQLVGQTTADTNGHADLSIIGGFRNNPAVPMQFYRAVLQH
jgi:hypothetical protein